MRGPRHISACIDEWLDTCPFNLPDALDAIREEYEMAIPSPAQPGAAMTTDTTGAGA